MKTVNDVLDAIIKEYGLEEYMKLETLRRKWRAIVGDMVAEHTEMVDYKARDLFILVDDPMWLQELKFREKKIIESINSRFNKKLVKRIVYRLQK